MRKVPRQERSRRMVERIVTAGREVLVGSGYDAFSTNRVAAAAGISPGSLYQYFPDKAAVLDVIVDRYWDEVADRVAAALADRVGETGPAMVRATAAAALAALETDRALLRVIHEDLPPRRLAAQRRALEQRVRQLLTAVLTARPGDPGRSPDVQAWVIVLAIENLTLRWVLDEPGADRAQLLDEIVHLVTGYVSTAQLGDPGPD
ncbi:TetR/AcrR family transcriptional regulator [Actinokineospora pegani]|uniref:TetR/AcrR family transcriptional regulator n=1 Tax=Actinokineospora pegani TaxID=2654637 RepID=UPI0018D4C555|nr:TetR/AcrR family transcriptional regulator [Actinokineospora pegani]